VPETLLDGPELSVVQLGPLTPREAEAVLWVAEGKTAWETGAIMGVAESTAVAHIKSATAKLEASTRPHLVTRAFIVGILQVGTTIVLIVAIFIRLPGDCYRPAARSRIRRREDEVEDTTPWTSLAGGDGGLKLPDVATGALAFFEQHQDLVVDRRVNSQPVECVQHWPFDDRCPARHGDLDRDRPRRRVAAGQRKRSHH
jgi:DNA-binding CsgD family transcriptional regulator